MDEQTQRWISVSAEGEASVAPDMAVVSFAVSGKGKELGQTRDDVNARASSVLARLRPARRRRRRPRWRRTSASIRSTTTARGSSWSAIGWRGR